MFVLFNDTSLQTITHREQRTNVKQINWRPISALFALTNGNWIVWKFSLPNAKAKSITAKIQAITLQPLRKYYLSDWLVLSPIFLSTHHRRDMAALWGHAPSNTSILVKEDFLSDTYQRLSGSQSCFCITCTAKQKQESISPPKTHFSFAFHYDHHEHAALMWP